jgi:hypothetical protein
MDLHNAEYWRSRAEEARAVATQMMEPHTKAVMLQIAQDYEKLAERAGRRSQIKAKLNRRRFPPP